MSKNREESDKYVEAPQYRKKKKKKNGGNKRLMRRAEERKVAGKRITLGNKAPP